MKLGLVILIARLKELGRAPKYSEIRQMALKAEKSWRNYSRYLKIRKTIIGLFGSMENRRGSCLRPTTSITRNMASKSNHGLQTHYNNNHLNGHIRGGRNWC